MSINTVADRILQAARSAGADVVFGLPGVHNLAFWRSSGEAVPRIMGVRHEQTAVYAADGMARTTGGIAVALTTTGPGAANAVGAFGEAAASHSPVVLVASEVPAEHARRGSVRGLLHESRDQAAIFEPLAKAVFRPRTADDACRDVGEAFAAALSYPRGPVYVDVPTDVLAQAGPEIGWSATNPIVPDRAAVTAAADAIAAADRVVLWAGGGVVQSGAEEALAALSARLKAPVVTTYAARGVVPQDHPWLIGLPPHEPEVADYVASADLLVAVGTEFDAMMTRNWQMPRPARLVSINCDAAAMTKNFVPDIAVEGDAQLTLDALNELIPDREGRDPGELVALRTAVWERLSAEAGGELVRDVEVILDAQTTLVLDMAIPGYWLGGYASVSRSRRLQYPVGWGTLGYALPASIGAAAADVGPVMVGCGDGGFMFAVGELATIAQEQLPITVLLVDDGGYGMLRYDQEHAGDDRRGVDLYRPDFVALARSFGIDAVSVNGTGDALQAALKDALASGTPRMVVLNASMRPPRTTSPRWFE